MRCALAIGGTQRLSDTFTAGCSLSNATSITGENEVADKLFEALLAEALTQVADTVQASFTLAGAAAAGGVEHRGENIPPLQGQQLGTIFPLSFLKRKTTKSVGNSKRVILPVVE